MTRRGWEKLSGGLGYLHAHHSDGRGATGLTGKQVLNRLLDDGGYDPVIAVLRKPMHRNHPRLFERVVAFDGLSALAPVALDVAFCCLGTTIRKAGSQEAFHAVDYGYVLAFARWARSNGTSISSCFFGGGATGHAELLSPREGGGGARPDGDRV